MNNMLLVPNITKNLLIVSQIAKHNIILFKFYSNSYYVKDNIKGYMLLKGTLSDILYKFDLKLCEEYQNATSPSSIDKMPTSFLNKTIIYVDNFVDHSLWY